MPSGRERNSRARTPQAAGPSILSPHRLDEDDLAWGLAVVLDSLSYNCLSLGLDPLAGASGRLDLSSGSHQSVAEDTTLEMVCTVGRKKPWLELWED
mgnify:CR=1 FL=1